MKYELTQDLVTGNALIDSEHRQLFAAVNSLMDACSQGKGRGQIQQTVMQEYARLQKSEQSLLFFINNISRLTASEREIIRLLLEGRKVHEIAGIRCVESSTIKTQIKSLLGKFGCSRTKEIVQVIRELNIEHLF